MENDSSNNEKQQGGESADAAAARAEVPAAAAGSPPHFLDHLASSVTRQVEISGPRDWQHLASGIDSLDLGMYVQWRDWEVLERALEHGKRSAENSKGVLWPHLGLRECLIYPSGKAPMFAYHLQTPAAHLFIARREKAAKSPNVYASLLSQALWGGPIKALRIVHAFVERLGGVIIATVPSRCDLCADFLIPRGLSLAFLQSHAVCQSVKRSHYLNGDTLQTYYFGSGGSPIMARIYDKSAEIAKANVKTWFYSIWKLPPETANVWRIEFQVRRELLRQMDIHALSHLQAKSGGLWGYLTDNWLSLRLLDNPNASRRTVHPWWDAVASLARDFGPEMSLERDTSSGGKAPADWYIAHAAGCVPGYAAREGVDDFDSAFGLLMNKIRDYWTSRDFSQRYRVERIRLGKPEGGDA